MGLNFEAVCHAHRVRRFIYRPHENPGLHIFFAEHEDCARRGGWDTVRIYCDSGYSEPPEGVLDGYTEEDFPPNGFPEDAR